jgi:hypothetical protein
VEGGRDGWVCLEGMGVSANYRSFM